MTMWEGTQTGVIGSDDEHATEMSMSVRSCDETERESDWRTEETTIRARDSPAACECALQRTSLEEERRELTRPLCDDV